MKGLPPPNIPGLAHTPHPAILAKVALLGGAVILGIGAARYAMRKVFGEKAT